MKAVIYTGLMLLASSSLALDVASTTTALRMRDTITGGMLSTTDPLFATVVSQVQAGDSFGAALTLANSKYFANYLARRLALQMQTPSLDVTGVGDTDPQPF